MRSQMPLAQLAARQAHMLGGCCKAAAVLTLLSEMVDLMLASSSAEAKGAGLRDGLLTN